MRSVIGAAAAATVLIWAATTGTASIGQTVAGEEEPADDTAQLSDVPAPPVPTEDSQMRAYIATLRPQAIAMGIAPALFDSTLPTLDYKARVVHHDRAQPGASAASIANPPAFAAYRDAHVDRVRISMGRARYATLRSLLLNIERKTGVPEQIMLAIYGHETGYGTFSGNFDLLNSLATLAYDGRRRALFASEFLKAMLLLQRGIPRSQLKGSWAGATGNPQFLPSVYLRLGTDGDGDGKVDIWNSEPDTLASIGNYLRDAGWKPGVPWGIAVRVPDGIDRAALRSPTASPRCPRVFARQSRWLTISEWRDKGLQMLSGTVPAENELATLIEPDGPERTAYLVTTNYRSILDYNCSNFYALSVGLLGDAILP